MFSGFRPPVLTREVRPARSWFLETLAVIVALGALGALAYTAACTAAPGIEHVYRCEAVFVCDDKPYNVTPSDGCASSLDEAYSIYADRLGELTAAATCHSQHFEPSCEATARLCTD